MLRSKAGAEGAGQLVEIVRAVGQDAVRSRDRVGELDDRAFRVRDQVDDGEDHYDAAFALARFADACRTASLAPTVLMVEDAVYETLHSGVVAEPELR